MHCFQLVAERLPMYFQHNLSKMINDSIVEVSDTTMLSKEQMHVQQNPYCTGISKSPIVFCVSPAWFTTVAENVPFMRVPNSPITIVALPLVELLI